jgi:hemoglobin-like flavoprotein
MGRRLSEETLATFHDSLDRVLQQKDFFDVFYERLMSRSPEIAAKFAGFDMARIKRLLRDAFYLKMMASDGNQRAAERLERMAARHAELGITRAMHETWLETLLSAVAERDPRYDARIEQSWRDVTRIGMDVMRSRAPA